MTKDEALRLALEALKEITLEHGMTEKARTAIKAALEAKDEPVGTAGELFTNTALERLDLRPSTGIYITPLPVAEPYKRPSRSDIKPLSDKEIDTIGATIFKAEFLDDTEVKSNRELARAIEAAHGIKGEA